jgi:hypothetical protein
VSHSSLSVTVISNLSPFFKLNPSTTGLGRTITELEPTDVTVTVCLVGTSQCELCNKSERYHIWCSSAAEIFYAIVFIPNLSQNFPTLDDILLRTNEELS